MADIPGFDIRFTTPEDLAYLREWFSDDALCNDYPFNPSEKEEALKNWIGFSKFKASLTGMMNDVPCAIGTLFLMPYRKVAHHSSFYLIVDPKERSKGIGTSMVRNLLHLAKTRFKLESLHAEVYDTSKLIPILEKLNFERFAKQDNFVKIGGKAHARLLYEHFFKEGI
jgi:putative acetyltransferase